LKYLFLFFLLICNFLKSTQYQSVRVQIYSSILCIWILNFNTNSMWCLLAFWKPHKMQFDAFFGVAWCYFIFIIVIKLSFTINVHNGFSKWLHQRNCIYLFTYILCRCAARIEYLELEICDFKMPLFDGSLIAQFETIFQMRATFTQSRDRHSLDWLFFHGDWSKFNLNHDFLVLAIK
jgi:hypothetical protein